MIQGNLFTETAHGLQAAPDAIAPCDPRVPDAAKPRLTEQCQKILERLRQGPATNDELAKISRKYTSRVSDLRAAGFDVECFEHDHKTGVTRYRLKGDQ